MEFEEIMNRNRAISSSAISKAVSGASAGNGDRVSPCPVVPSAPGLQLAASLAVPPLPAGDYSDAIETLLTATAVIKQSRVANDERCRVLLSSLKDCLHGIEAKSYSTGSSGSSTRYPASGGARGSLGFLEVTKTLFSFSQGKDTGLGSALPAGPVKAVGGTGTSCTTRIGTRTISRSGTGSTKGIGTGTERGTGTTETGEPGGGV